MVSLEGASSGQFDKAFEAPQAFSILTARNMLFSRLPDEIRTQTAYRHFYTDDLDPKSGNLSLQFFSLCVSYFCCLCRLEARRAQYIANQTDKSGSGFARAHRKARAVFKRLNATYGMILMRYNTHNTLVYRKKLTPKERTELARGPSIHATGAKPLGPPMKRERAFVYVADEMRFYEELFVFAEEMLRLAFTDDRLQQPIAEEINRIFRSQSFNFGDMKRDAKVKGAVAEMDEHAVNLTQNNQGLAEVLVQPVKKITMKYAVTQRSPFVAARFPGGMSALKYQRIPAQGAMRPNSSSAGRGKAGGPQPLLKAPSNDDQLFTLETQVPAFPPNHRVVVTYQQQQQRVEQVPSLAGSPKRRPLSSQGGDHSVASPTSNASTIAPARKPKPTGGSLAHNRPGHAFLPKLQDFDAVSPGGSVVEEEAKSETVSNASRSMSLSFTGDIDATLQHSMNIPDRDVKPPRALSPADGSQSASRSSALLKSKASAVRSAMALRGRKNTTKLPAAPMALSEEELARIAPSDPTTGEEDWARYDPVPEIDKVYQSLANGVVIHSFAIPADIMCEYDDNGLLIPPTR